MIQTKFGFNWSSSFRGEDFLKRLRRTTDDDDGRKAHHYAYTDQIWAFSGLKLSSFGHLKKFPYLVMAAILDTGRR
jgi:hypothetical protein